MTTTKWNQAAQGYQATKAAQQRHERDRIAAMVHDQVLQDKSRRQQETEIDRGTAELEQFMQTEGQAAMELLRASERHINFGEVNDGGGFGEVYFIDGNGLRQCTEAMGMWVAYSKDVPKPTIVPINASQAVEAAVHHGGKKAMEIVSWLRAELDKIASEAPANT